jgi:hypothetical protein
MPMNYKRGFRRIGFVVWIVYALGVIASPLFLAVQQRKDAFSLAQDYYRLCEDAPAVDGHETCYAQLNATIKKDQDSYPLFREYRDWNVLWVAPVAILVPPLMLYGCIRGLIALGSWITGGFRGNPGAHI